MFFPFFHNYPASLYPHRVFSEKKNEKEASKILRLILSPCLGMGLCTCSHFWMRPAMGASAGLQLWGCALLCFHGNYISAFCRLSATQVNANISHFSHNKAEKKRSRRRRALKKLSNVFKMCAACEIFLNIYTDTHTQNV